MDWTGQYPFDNSVIDAGFFLSLFSSGETVTRLLAWQERSHHCMIEFVLLLSGTLYLTRFIMRSGEYLFLKFYPRS